MCITASRLFIIGLSSSWHVGSHFKRLSDESCIEQAYPCDVLLDLVGHELKSSSVGPAHHELGHFEVVAIETSELEETEGHRHEQWMIDGDRKIDVSEMPRTSKVGKMACLAPMGKSARF